MVHAKETKPTGSLLDLAKWELKRAIKKPFHLLGFEVSRRDSEKGGVWNNPPSTKKHQRILPSATYSPWLSDPKFLETYEKIREYTLVDIYRCYELWSLAKQTSDFDGNILEVGVWRGGTGAMLAEAVKEAKHKRVYLADTFAGVVKAGKHDTSYKGGEHSDTSIEVVNTLINSLSLNNTEILQGMFPEDTGGRVHGNISLLHCDVDVYLSSRDIVEWCLPRFTVGSILVFDDFGFSGCEGVTTFCEEFTARRGFRFIHNLNGHAIFIKIAE